MSLKKFLQNDIVNPTAANRGEVFYKVAIVTKADENNNVCSIKYIDKDAFESNKDNVQVKIYSHGVQDWFPEKDDIVSIEEVNGVPIITGIPEEAYAAKVKGKNDLETDILSDEMSCETGGGYVY
ncbi:hypothetical protein [Bacillus atrophaeus]|uniref:hypothetical protein n=1 Tax=Bacillus atrophaeus TaxID=1452 RepID=UPI002281A81D|nr:hypothetical protein [Bacillus atrophaeus]MCY7866121.1 hypothetical protein [Bacillus spizizenii]MCY8890315.1 hypothetical protein [Bacillus spizizenii]MEC0842038.1 hypothetical protein [Bacillus spizizenii]MED1125343.1 hypothetical protein [Bacillus atrophaeus]